MDSFISVGLCLPNGETLKVTQPRRVNVTFKWTVKGLHEPKCAFLAGSWNEWQFHHPLYVITEGRCFSTNVKLLPGKYEYKFIVDGVWSVDEEKPWTLDKNGNPNNIVTVEPSDEGDDDLLIDCETLRRKAIEHLETQLPYVPFWKTEILDFEAKAAATSVKHSDIGTVSLKIDEPANSTELVFQFKIVDDKTEQMRDLRPFGDEAQIDLDVPPNISEDLLANKFKRLCDSGVLQEDLQYYRTKCGELLLLDRTYDTCKKFGFLPENVVRTPTLGIGKALGVYGGNMWFHLKIHSGASYWNNGENFVKFRDHIGMQLLSFVSEKKLTDYLLDKSQQEYQDPISHLCRPKAFENQPSSLVEHLPQEIIISIFSYLVMFQDRVSVSLVCKRWNELVLDGSLWRYVDYSLHTRVKESSFLKCFRVFGKYVKHLCVANCSNLSEESWMAISSCSHLEELNISGCKVATSELLDILHNCSRVRSLAVTETIRWDPKRVLNAIETLPNLKELTMILTSNWSEHVLRSPSLEMYRCRQTSPTLECPKLIPNNKNRFAILKHGELGEPLRVESSGIETLKDLKRCVNRFFGYPFHAQRVSEKFHQRWNEFPVKWFPYDVKVIITEKLD